MRKSKIQRKKRKRKTENSKQKTVNGKSLCVQRQTQTTPQRPNGKWIVVNEANLMEVNFFVLLTLRTYLNTYIHICI